jgi:hypothetical protein
LITSNGRSSPFRYYESIINGKNLQMVKLATPKTMASPIMDAPVSTADASDSGLPRFADKRDMNRAVLMQKVLNDEEFLAACCTFALIGFASVLSSKLPSFREAMCSFVKRCVTLKNP